MKKFVKFEFSIYAYMPMLLCDCQSFIKESYLLTYTLDLINIDQSLNQYNSAYINVAVTAHNHVSYRLIGIDQSRSLNVLQKLFRCAHYNN